MKPRIRYCWEAMRWMADSRQALQHYNVYVESCRLAETINRRIRLQHVGAHL